MLETSAGKILRLEIENKRLLKQLASLRGADNSSTATKVSTATKLRRITNSSSSNTAATNGVDEDDLVSTDTRQKLQARLGAIQSVGDDYSALETKASLLEFENKRLTKKVQSLQEAAAKVELLERENGRLVVELEQGAANAKEWSKAVAEVELEKRRLERTVRLLEKGVDATRPDRLPVYHQPEEELQMETDRPQRHAAVEADDVAPLREDEAPEKLTCEDVGHNAPVNTQSDLNR